MPSIKARLSPALQAYIYHTALRALITNLIAQRKPMLIHERNAKTD
jgi:hypothetical protein